MRGDPIHGSGKTKRPPTGSVSVIVTATSRALFGSVLRSDFSPESDVDLIVEFQPGRTPGLAFFRLESELSALLGRRMDLNTKASLSPYFRDRVLFEARALYVAA
jgi:predicted nucleotidyltransferase